MSHVIAAGALLLTLIAGLTIGQSCASDGTLDAEVARLRTEALEAGAREDGWATALAEAQEDLVESARRAADSTDALSLHIADLLEQVQLLDGEVQSVTEFAANLSSQLQASAQVHGPEEEADSITAAIDDGLLSGRVAYFPKSTLFDLLYSAKIRAALVQSIAPDGRLLVAAQAEDPRVQLEIEALEFQAPEPIRACTLGQRASAFSVGGGIGLIAGALLR
jgi:hypothetical protein